MKSQRTHWGEPQKQSRHVRLKNNAVGKYIYSMSNYKKFHNKSNSHLEKKKSKQSQGSTGNFMRKILCLGLHDTHAAVKIKVIIHFIFVHFIEC